MEERGRNMKRALALGLAVLAIAAVATMAGKTDKAAAKPAAGSLVGTGATFPFPLISKCARLSPNYSTVTDFARLRG